MPITVRADDTLAQSILKMLREDYEAQEADRGSATHVSDLIFPRRTWLAKHFPKPLTDYDLLYFTAGRAHHEIIERMMSADALREVHVNYRGIVGTIDVLEADGSPVEVKTTRVKDPYVPSNMPDHFITQLGCYSAMLRPEELDGKGTIVLFYLGVKEKVETAWRSIPKLKSFGVDFDNLPQIRMMMLHRKALLEGDTLPSTETCHSWLCRVCKWYQNNCNGWGSDLEYRVHNSMQPKQNWRDIWIASH